MLNIQDLSKEIDMTAVRGGMVFQNVPTVGQLNQVNNEYHVSASGPVAIDTNTDASNDASLPSILGSLFVLPAIRAY